MQRLILLLCLFQIASMICAFYKLCEDGKEERVRERLSQLPVAGTQNCVSSRDNAQEHDIEVCRL